MAQGFSRKQLLLVLLALPCLYIGKSYFFPSEEQKIRDLLGLIVSRLQFSATAHPIARAAEVRRLSPLLAETIELSIDSMENGQNERREETKLLKRRELEDRAIMAKSSMKSLEITMLPPSVRVAGDEAQANTEVHILGSLPEAEGQFYEHHELEIGLRKENSAWKIFRVKSKNLR